MNCRPCLLALQHLDMVAFAVQLQVRLDRLRVVQLMAWITGPLSRCRAEDAAALLASSPGVSR